MMNSTLNLLFRGFHANVHFNPCTDWTGPNHIFFQLANSAMFLGLCFSSTSIYSLIFLRTMLLLSCLFTMLWTWLITCTADILLWNALFASLNLIHIFVLIYKLHPFIRFPHEVEMAYQNLFKPLGMSRVQFKRLYSCTSCIKSLKAKDHYALEKETLVDKLSLLLTGRVSVTQNGIIRHIIDCNQFLESPEWFGMNINEKYQVSISALEDSQFLVWNRDKLKLTISSDRYLQTILDHVLGRDIVKKLMLSMDIESTNSSSEKAKLLQTNLPLEPIMSLNNTLRNTNFWNLSASTIENDTSRETSL